MAYSKGRRLAQLLSSDGTVSSGKIPAGAIDTTKIAAAALQISSESFADDDTSLMTSASVQDKILAYGYTTEVGDLTSVTAGTNLNGGGTSGDLTLNLDTTITGLSSVTSTAFVGNITGNVTGNTSGTAATVTTAAQPAITSVGTLTTLTIDNVIIDGTTIGHTSDNDLLTLTSGNLNVAGNTTITGNLTVDGTTTTINSTTLSVDDKNIELGSVASPSDSTADGGGITLKGASDKTILWVNSTDSWDFNQAVRSTNGFIGNVTGDVTGSAGSATGNAATATALATARTIGGTSFDGTANIVPATAVAVTGAAQTAITSVGTLSALSTGTITSTGHLSMAVDNSTIYLGAGLDLRLYHDGSNSYISDTGDGNLIIKSSTAEVHGTDGGKLAGFYSEGRAALYYNNAEKFRTVSGGVTVTGDLTGVSNLYVADDIGHTGDSDTYLSWNTNNLTIYNGGTNNLYLDAGQVVFNESGGGVDFRVESANQANMLVVDASADKIGIGVATPTAILDVRGSGDVSIKQHLINSGQTTAGRETEFIFGKDNGANVAGNLKYYYHTTQAARRIDLFHYTTSNGISILNGGNVGINTTNPQASLDIKGDNKKFRMSASSDSAYRFEIENRYDSNNTININATSGTNLIKWISNTTSLSFNNALIGIRTTTPKATLHLKPTGNNWEDGILLEHDDATTGWNIHPEQTGNGLWFGYNADTSVALTSQNASPILKLVASGEVNVTGNLVVSGVISSATTLSSFTDRIRIINGSDQMNIGQWDTANHRIEGDATRPISIQSYHTSGGIKLGASGTTKLQVLPAGVTVTGTLDVSGTTKLDGGNGYFRDGVGNSFSSGWDADSDDHSTWINFEGYQGGTTRFRDLRIGTGKQSSFVHFDGSAAGVSISGTLGVTGHTSLSTVIIDGVSNYSGLEVKGVGAARPQVKFTNVNQGLLGQIYGTEGNALVIATGTGGATAITIDSSQKVGIGASPDELLTVAGDVDFSGQMYAGTGSGRRPFVKHSNWGYAASYKATVLGSTSTSYNTNISGSTTLSFNYDPSGNSNGSFGGNGSEILFRNGTQLLTPNSSDNAWHSHMVSMHDGNVGIAGGYPPSYHTKARNLVVGRGAAGGITYFGGTNESWFAFARAAANNSDAYDGGISYNGDRDLKFHTNAGATRMTIDGSGNVGIGTAAPGANLHVYSAGQAIARVEGANQYYSGLMIRNNYSSVQSQWHVAAAGGTSGWGATSGNFIIRDDTTNSTGIEIERGAGGSTGAMVIKDSGAIFCSEEGSNGDYSMYIGSVNAGNTGNRYVHVQVGPMNGSMYWIEAMGFDYTASIIEGRCGGYQYNTGATYTPYANVTSGDIPVQYQTSAGIEIVIDTGAVGTSNRWGGIVLRGGSDTISANTPMEIIQYSYTSATTRVY